jgi:two-component system sensor histidine kinase UhpB
VANAAAVLRVAVLLGALLAALGGHAFAQTEPVAIRLYIRALSVNGDAPSFPIDRPAVEVPLPDDWTTSRPHHEGIAWYRVAVDAPRPGDGELLGLYVERVCSTFEVRLNGRPIYGVGRLSEPVTRQCYEPQLVVLPAALMLPHGNLLDLKVSGHALEHVVSRDRAGGLSVLRVGPLPVLAQMHDVQQFWNVTLAQGVGLALGMLGVVMVGMGWINRRASYLLCFGALALGWALFSTRIWLTRLPVDNATAEFVIASSFAPLAALVVLFLLRYAHVRHRPTEAALAAQCVLMPLTLAAAPEHLYAVATGWFALLALEVAAAAAVHLHAGWRRKRGEFAVMSMLMGVLVIALAVEMAVRAGLIERPDHELMRLVLPLLVLVLSVRLAQLFARALRAAETSRATLESRVRDATAEIERNFSQLAEMRVERVTEQERKRIAADLHDDLGAKLLTIVHTSESEHISTLAREALEEMRLSVRGLTGRPVRVADALADWRAETVSRLGQAGVEADWQGPGDDLAQLMSARCYVQTTRILREAVSNIIKHSGASHCRVECTVGEHDVQLSVQDNGRGIPLQLDGRLDRGHGMTSMKRRAKQMQGQCLVESGPGYGTVIRLTLPL